MSIMTNNPAKCELASVRLKEVDDPEIGLNVVDLGLIYELNFMEADKQILCNMTLTTQFCPMGESIVDHVQQALQEVFPDHVVHLNLTFEPRWNREFISEEGLQFLNR